MKDEIKEILDIYSVGDRELNIDYIDKLGIKKEYEDISNEALLDYITNLQEEKTKIRKILIEHIEEARYELNVILHSDNDLNYKNECSKEFEILNKNIIMILNKIDNILQGEDND